MGLHTKLRANDGRIAGTRTKPKLRNGITKLSTNAKVMKAALLQRPDDLGDPRRLESCEPTNVVEKHHANQRVLPR